MIYKTIERKNKLSESKWNILTTTNHISFLDLFYWWGKCHTSHWSVRTNFQGAASESLMEGNQAGNQDGWPLAAALILKFFLVFSPFANCRTEEVREQLGCHMYFFFFFFTPVLFILRSTTVVITSSYRARSLWGRLKHPASSHFHDSYPSSELPASVNGCVMQVLPF